VFTPLLRKTCSRVRYTVPVPVLCAFLVNKLIYSKTGMGLKDADKNIGINWIAKKNNFYIQFCGENGEINKQKSDYFFDSYLKQEVQSKMNPLDWWKQSVTTAAPNKLLDIINILFILPASSAGIERCFSTMGNIMTKQRNRLTIEKATKLCCINGFYKIVNADENRKNNIERLKRNRKFPTQCEDE
jgi:hAT family protein